MAFQLLLSPKVPMKNKDLMIIFGCCENAISSNFTFCLLPKPDVNMHPYRVDAGWGRLISKFRKYLGIGT